MCLHWPGTPVIGSPFPDPSSFPCPACTGPLALGIHSRAAAGPLLAGPGQSCGAATEHCPRADDAACRSGGRPPSCETRPRRVCPADNTQSTSLPSRESVSAVIVSRRYAGPAPETNLLSPPSLRLVAGNVRVHCPACVGVGAGKPGGSRLPPPLHCLDRCAVNVAGNCLCMHGALGCTWNDANKRFQLGETSMVRLLFPNTCVAEPRQVRPCDPL